MSRMPQATESERIMAQAQSMIDEASVGLAQLEQACQTAGIDDGPQVAALEAAIARGAPAWMVTTQRAAANDIAASSLQHHDRRRARKHRNLV